jgi:uncharacterized membrane protein
MTSSDPHPRDPHQLEHWVHRILIAGLAVSATLLMAGMVAMLAKGERHAPVDKSIADLFADASRLNGPALVTLGLLALMITPILRVVVLLLGWTQRRDWLFAGIALAVLVLLILSLSLSVG